MFLKALAAFAALTASAGILYASSVSAGPARDLSTPSRGYSTAHDILTDYVSSCERSCYEAYERCLESGNTQSACYIAYNRCLNACPE